MAVQDYELLLRVRADMLQAINGLDGVSKKLDSTASEAERTSQRASASVDKLGDKFKGLQGLIAGLAIGAGIKAVFDAVTESENAIAQLDARLKSTKSSSGLTREELINLSGEMQNLTKYGDEAVLSMETLLLTFTSIRGPQFREATQVVLDMSTALGQDLQSTATQVGKALNNPILGITALTKVGVNFTDAQKDVIKSLVDTGQAAQAQEVILRELQTEYGGAAEAAANTFGGALEQLKNAAGDLLEGDGGNLPETAASIRELTHTLQDPQVKQGFAAIVNGMVSVVNYAARAIGYLTTFKNVVADALNFGPDMQKSLDTLYSKRADLEHQLDYIVKFSADKGEDPEAKKIAQRIKDLDALIMKKREAAEPVQAPVAAASGATASAIDTLPTLTVHASQQASADKAAADKAAAQAAKFIAAGGALQQTLIDLQGALDPTAKAWADYNKAVDDANAKAALAKQAPGANVASIEAQRNAIIQLAATQRDAAIDKISDADKKAYQDLLATIGTPAQAQLAQPLKQLADLNAMLAAGKITAEEFAAAKAKLGDSVTTDALPTYGGNDALIGGAAGELFKASQAQQQLEDAYAKQQEKLVQAREQKLLTQAQYDAKEEALENEHAARLAAIDQAKQQAALSAAVTGFGQLADAAKSAYGEQSKQYRIAFALQKAAALAQSILAIQTSVAESSKLGWPWNIVSIAAAVAQGVSVLATIKGTNLGGGYSDGGYTGPGGKYEPAGVVHAGEVVWSQGDIARAGGVGVVEAMRLGYRGYAEGGFVGTPNPVMPPASLGAPAGNNGQAPQINQRIVVGLDTSVLDDWATGSSFERAVKVTIGKNPSFIKQAVR